MFGLLFGQPATGKKRLCQLAFFESGKDGVAEGEGLVPPFKCVFFKTFYYHNQRN